MIASTFCFIVSIHFSSLELSSLTACDLDAGWSAPPAVRAAIRSEIEALGAWDPDPRTPREAPPLEEEFAVGADAAAELRTTLPPEPLPADPPAFPEVLTGAAPPEPPPPPEPLLPPAEAP